MKYSSTLFSMPRPAFTRRKPMPAENRAAQFAPFAALTGYEEEIREVCRFTDSRRLPGEDLQAELERNLNLLHEREEERPYVRILYFLPDTVKEGGSFLTAEGELLSIDPLENRVFMADGTHVPIPHICGMESPLFESEDP